MFDDDDDDDHVMICSVLAAVYTIVVKKLFCVFYFSIKHVFFIFRCFFI